MLIRLALESDLPAVMSLVREALPLMHAVGNFQWDDDYPTARVFERDIQRGELWVAEAEGGEVAAAAAINTDQPDEYHGLDWNMDEPALAIHRLAVSRAHRGSGLGSALMQKAEEIARERSVPLLRVDTSFENPTAQRMFARLGYTYRGEIGLGFRPGLRVLCYEKRLEARP